MIVNGQQETLGTPISVTELIEQRGLRPERVAIELNGDIVPRNKRSEVMLHDGDTVEIVSLELKLGMDEIYFESGIGG